MSVDQSEREVVREFFEEEGIEHLGLYIDTSARVLADLRIRGIPTTLILDAEGREIARISGEADWAEPASMRFSTHRRTRPAAARMHCLISMAHGTGAVAANW